MTLRKKKSLCKKLSTFDRGYISGLMDGEGSIFVAINRFNIARTRFRPQVSIVLANSEVIAYLKKVTGIGYIGHNLRDKRKLKNDKTKKYKTRSYWRLYSFADIKALLQQLQLIVKKKQKEIMLKICNSRLNKPMVNKVRYKNGRMFITPSYPAWDKKERAWVMELKKLNERGEKIE